MSSVKTSLTLFSWKTRLFLVCVMNQIHGCRVIV